MSTRRYGITLDPDIYQQWRLASVKEGLSVGDWLMAQMMKGAAANLTSTRITNPRSPVAADLPKATEPYPGYKPIPTGPDPGKR